MINKITYYFTPDQIRVMVYISAFVLMNRNLDINNVKGLVLVGLIAQIGCMVIIFRTMKFMRFLEAQPDNETFAITDATSHETVKKNTSDEQNNYTDAQVHKIKQQWLQTWTTFYGFVVFIVIILCVCFEYEMISAEALKSGVSKVLVPALKGFFYAFLPLYYCAYKRPGTRLIGFFILLNLTNIGYDFICFCIALTRAFQGEFIITTCLAQSIAICGIYCLHFLWKGYVCLIFYRLYQVNSFLQKAKSKNNDGITNIR